MSENSTIPSYRITDLAAGDRPRERLEKLGAQALSNAELIAILLRVGVPGGSICKKLYIHILTFIIITNIFYA